MKTRTFTSSFLRLASSVLLTLALTVAVCDIKAQSAKSPAVPSASVKAKVSQPDTWSAGAVLPTPLVRAVGVFFPANGKFYAMGGRSADGTGNDLLHPLEYDPNANTWTTKAGTFSSNYVNNMVCGTLTQGGTPYIFCVGGSFGGGTDAIPRVTRYDPVADVFTDLPAADNWPGDPHDGMTEVLPGGFVVNNNKLYIIGGFNVTPVSCGPTDCMTHQTWVFDPTAASGSRWTQKSDYPVNRGYIPTTTGGSTIFTAGGSMWVVSGQTIADSADSYKYNIATDTWTAITMIPRATAETRALNVLGLVWVMGGGRNAPNPSNEVDIYNPYCNTWTVSTQPFITARRNFPTDTEGVSRVWLAGGYDTTGLPNQTMEIDKFPMATSAVSRKIQGSTPFDVPLPLNGPTGIECRIGPTYQLVVTFATPVTVGSAAVTCGTGSVGSMSGNGTTTITVNLTGVTDVQRITVTLSNVSDGTNTGDVPISMGVLVGDVNANGAVNASDVALTKSKVGQTIGSSNFREDVNANGTISATDVALVKSDIGHALP
jgi:Dockerin type I domain/Kelch motif